MYEPFANQPAEAVGGSTPQHVMGVFVQTREWALSGAGFRSIDADPAGSIDDADATGRRRKPQASVARGEHRAEACVSKRGQRLDDVRARGVPVEHATIEVRNPEASSPVGR